MEEVLWNNMNITNNKKHKKIGLNVNKDRINTTMAMMALLITT